MTTFCHIGCGRLGIAIANAMMLLQGGDGHIFHEPVAALRDKFELGEFAEMQMVAKATGNEIALARRLRCFPGEEVKIIITAGKPRTSPKQDKVWLIRDNYSIVSRLVSRIPSGCAIYVATNPPEEICRRLKKHRNVDAIPLRACTDNLRKGVWGDGWKEANDRMLAAKGYTSYGPAVAIAKEVLGL